MKVLKVLPHTHTHFGSHIFTVTHNKSNKTVKTVEAEGNKNKTNTVSLEKEKKAMLVKTTMVLRSAGEREFSSVLLCATN